ncbi:hypothetical protein CLCR_01004 [Cladophialophora carrionii]|uniref:Uncharacterized protein n=1 Tax=Cladophialophora carrionii TaxID=86049 RepID=A0A1C1D187_9EURO|nr:hypothetical protein CLCR_01004 [Cladophialophora carrionii]
MILSKPWSRDHKLWCHVDALIPQFLKPIHEEIVIEYQYGILRPFHQGPAQRSPGKVTHACEDVFSDNMRIRNFTISTANELANAKGEPLSSLHISQALTANG